MVILVPLSLWKKLLATVKWYRLITPGFKAHASWIPVWAIDIIVSSVKSLSVM
jgi:hypothetical protein